jgi:c-di-GMP-binding flagellar brake protein YcgR
MNNEPAQPINEEGQQVIDSKDEILSVIQSMILASTPCAAYMDDTEKFLVCSIAGVESKRDAIYLRYDTDSPVLKELLQSKSIRYISSHEDVKLQFLSAQPQTGSFRGTPALRIPLPRILWCTQRREHPRHTIGRGELKIILNFAGIGHVEAEAADLSISGVGIIHYHPQLKLETGLILEDCEIRIPNEAPIKVKMRIQHSTPIQFPDGEIVKRAGCQFIDLSQMATAVLATYLNKLKTNS